MKTIALPRSPKRFFFQLTVFLALLGGMVSCDTGGSANIDIRAKKLEDNQGRFLGDVGAISYDQVILLYTKTGYWVAVDWGGNIPGTEIYYTDVDGLGTAFIISNSSDLTMKKAVRGIDKYYYYTRDEYRESAENPLTYLSRSNNRDEIENEQQPQNSRINNYYLLKEIQYEEIGLPSDIELPLKVLWD